MIARASVTLSHNFNWFFASSSPSVREVLLKFARRPSRIKRDRGYVYERLECWQPALKDLTEYLEREPDAHDHDDVRVKMMELRTLCGRMS